jgi:hypothetical protein
LTPILILHWHSQWHPPKTNCRQIGDAPAVRTIVNWVFWIVLLLATVATVAYVALLYYFVIWWEL